MFREIPEVVSKMPTRNVRSIVLEELVSGPKSWSEILGAVKKQRSLSDSAFYYHLSTLIRKGKIKKVILSDGSAKYELVEPTRIKPKARLQDADRSEVDFLLDIISRAPTEETVSQALADLIEICRTQKVAQYNEIWEFLIRALHDQTLQNHWSSLLSVLLWIYNNAEESDDKETIKRLKTIMLPTVLEIAKTPIRARNEALALLEKILTNNEKFQKFKEVAEKVIMEESGAFPNLGVLGDFYKTRKMEIWRWLYKLMESPDKNVRQRAADFLSYLRSAAEPY